MSTEVLSMRFSKHPARSCPSKSHRRRRRVELRQGVRRSRAPSDLLSPHGHVQRPAERTRPRNRPAPHRGRVSANVILINAMTRNCESRGSLWELCDTSASWP